MKDLMIWTDAEAYYMGKGIKDPENDYSTIL